MDTLLAVFKAIPVKGGAGGGRGRVISVMPSRNHYSARRITQKSLKQSPEVLLYCREIVHTQHDNVTTDSSTRL